MATAPRVVALIAVRNEADIILENVHALSAAGISAYVIDDGSEDGTVECLRPLIGRGVLGIETLPPRSDFNLRRILERKERLCRDIEADWFINHDADEFRDPPWPGVTLAQAISRVDEAGFNAIDFALFDFWPVDESEPPPDGVQSHLRHCETGQQFNRLQVRCWKRTSAAVDLVSSGGHDVRFEGRRVFPYRFLLRHYPVRSTVHGRRKVLGERRPRYAEEERAGGWHVQYDAFDQDSTFVRRREELTVFDADAARIAIAQQDAERVLSTIADLEQRLESVEAQCLAGHQAVAQRTKQLDTAQEELQAERRRAADLETICAERDAQIEQVRATLREVRSELSHSQAGSASLREELHRVYDSRTWRWTSGLRRAARLFGVT